MSPVRILVRVVVVLGLFYLPLVALPDLPAASAGNLNGRVEEETQPGVNLGQAGESQRSATDKDGNAPKPFKLGAKQETIAWEKWHKRLVKEIMHRTEDRAVTIAKLGGIRISSLAFKTVRMQMDIVVTRDKHVTGTVLVPAENAKLTDAMIEAVKSLDGDDVVAFPVQSERQKVDMIFSYIRGPKVLPGTKWIKNDYEPINNQDGH